MMIKKLAMLSGPLFIAVLVSCGGGDDAPQDPNDPIDPISAVTACTNTAADSPAGPRSGRIHSEILGDPIYQQIIGVRSNQAGGIIDIDYMVHPAVGAAKALLVLIQGGNGNAVISGTIDSAPDSAGGNFLVRSAHLFAAQGYKVVTVDQPSDFNPDTPNTTYNLYRASAAHAVDLSTIINAELVDSPLLPVIISGTSRGAMSAVAHHKLVDAIALSSPVTNDIRESAAVNEASETIILRPSSVGLPTHVMWHVGDACAVSPVSGSENLVSAFSPDASNNPVSGGFDADIKVSDCKGHTVHGFYGIESCALGLETAWMGGLSLPSTHPVQLPAVLKIPITDLDTPLNIPVGAGIVPAIEGAELTFSLPQASTSLGGTITIVDKLVTYTPPAGVNGTTDRFVYLVTETGGGKLSRVVSVKINPAL